MEESNFGGSGNGADPRTVDAARSNSGTTSYSKEEEAKTIARLAAMKPMDYDRVRRQEAKDLGIQVKTLDDLVNKARNSANAPERLPFVEVEPFDDPIDPAVVLDEVVTLTRRYVVLDLLQAYAVALWIVLTWVIEDVEVAALLIINAPEKACGKSQLLTVIGLMVARALSAANSSTSFLFRSITMWRPTLLIDEADTFIKENHELKGLINAGHTRANAFVGRTVAVGDGHEPKLFDVWSAKAFAGIALERHLPDATMSRGIVIGLRRKLASETVERLRHADKDAFATVASKLARFAEDYGQQVRASRPSLPDALSDRAQDNWEPLFAIAGCAGPEWLERASAAALALSHVDEPVVSTGNELLADIQEVFEQKRVTKISTADLIDNLTQDEEKAWATYNRGKAMSPRQLAKQLLPYAIKPKTIRFSDKHTPKGYDLAQFEDAFARYLAPAPEKLPPQRNGSDAETALVPFDDPETDRPGVPSTGMPPLSRGGVADTPGDTATRRAANAREARARKAAAAKSRKDIY